MTEIEIANLAISLTGVSNPISDLDDDSTDASLCKQFMDGCLRTVLGAYDWSRARRRAALTADALEEPEFGTENIFPLPADCVRVRSVEDEDGIVLGTYGDDDTPALFYDSTGPVNITYTKRIQAESFSDEMAEAAAHQLAYKLAGANVGKSVMSFNYQESARAALARAIAAERHESGGFRPPIVTVTYRSNQSYPRDEV